VNLGMAVGRPIRNRPPKGIRKASHEVRFVLGPSDKLYDAIGGWRILGLDPADGDRQFAWKIYALDFSPAFGDIGLSVRNAKLDVIVDHTNTC
jgi:hypothetical protein